jgi:hypothetical protein
LISLSLSGLWLGWQRGSRIGWALLGLALGLGQYFYVSMRLAPLLVAVWCLAIALQPAERHRRRLAGLAQATGVAVVTALPLIVLALREPSTWLAPFLRVSLAAEPVAFGDLGPRTLFALGRLAKAVLGFFGEPLQSFYSPGVAMLLPAAAALAATGLLLLVLDHDRRGLLLLLPVGLVIGSNLLSTELPAAQRYVMSAPCLAILVALPLGRMIDAAADRSKALRVAAIVATCVVMLWLAASELRLFYGEVPSRWQLGGVNTSTANALARHVAQRERSAPHVYYFGSPRMGLPPEMRYRAPSLGFENVLDALSGAPDWEIDGPTLFYFLPERAQDSGWVRQAYPAGEWGWVAPEDAPEIGFWFYALPGP